jgi:hypothetical protein
MKFGIGLARAHPSLWPKLTRTSEALDGIARFAAEVVGRL